MRGAHKPRLWLLRLFGLRRRGIDWCGSNRRGIGRCRNGRRRLTYSFRSPSGLRPGLLRGAVTLHDAVELALRLAAEDGQAAAHLAFHAAVTHAVDVAEDEMIAALAVVNQERALVLHQRDDGCVAGVHPLAVGIVALHFHQTGARLPLAVIGEAVDLAVVQLDRDAR